jgi:hypothetical protein
MHRRLKRDDQRESSIFTAAKARKDVQKGSDANPSVAVRNRAVGSVARCCLKMINADSSPP